MRDVRQVLLTHIHLDHAGATGSLLEANPEIEVFVHERGARHLIDPSKLDGQRHAGSTARTWTGCGATSCRCRRARVRVLNGGEQLAAGGRELEVAQTPGHASTTSATSIASSGVAFVGDTAGIRRGDRRLHPAADAASRHRPRGLAGQRRSHPGVGAGHAVPDSLRPIPRRPDRTSRSCSSGWTPGARSSGGCSRTRRSTTRSASAGSSRRAGRKSGERSARQKLNSTAAPAGWTTHGRDSPGTGGRGWGEAVYSLSALSVIRRFVFGQNPRRTAVRVLVLAAVSFITFRWVLIPIRTEGSSMLPTYTPDRLHFVNRLAYGAGGPARGDVVAIQMAGPHVVYVKRIVGLPGERVAIAGGQVQINGTALAEPMSATGGPGTSRK